MFGILGVDTISEQNRVIFITHEIQYLQVRLLCWLLNDVSHDFSEYHSFSVSFAVPDIMIRHCFQ